jgi:hypothetical protein
MSQGVLILKTEPASVDILRDQIGVNATASLKHVNGTHHAHYGPFVGVHLG